MADGSAFAVGFQVTPPSAVAAGVCGDDHQQTVAGGGHGRNAVTADVRAGRSVQARIHERGSVEAHFENALRRLRFEGVRGRKIFRGRVAGHVDVSLAVEGHGGGSGGTAAGQYLMSGQHLAAGMNRAR